MKKLLVILIVLMCSHAHAATLYLAAPKTSGWAPTQSVSEIDGVHKYNVNAKLVLRDDNGVDHDLVTGAVWDFSISPPDKRKLYLSKIANGRSDIYSYNVETDELIQITNGPGWNCQPVEMGDGSIAFLSDRDGWQNPDEKYRAFTTYRMDWDGKNVERLNHMAFGGVYGLFVAKNGRLLYTSGENQGGRPGRGNNWSIWSHNPDGGDFRPEMSAFDPHPFDTPVLDWPAITTNDWLVVAKYYDTRIYGMLLAAANDIGSSPMGFATIFGNLLWQNSPNVHAGWVEGGRAWIQTGWWRRGMISIARFAHPFDFQAEGPDGVTPVGMLTHPYPSLGGKVYATWTGDKGDANMDLGIYEIDPAHPAEMPSGMVKIIDEVGRHEWMGKPYLSYPELFGVARPANPKSAMSTRLPLGSPYGEVGTSSLDWNEWVSRSEDPAKNKRVTMPKDGAVWMRFVAFDPTLVGQNFMYEECNNSPDWDESNLTRQGFHSVINELTGVYTKLVPIPKWRGPNGELHMGPNPPAGYTRILRPEDGAPDTSFLAQLPADQCWTFQILNAKKEAIIMARTWHAVISGEKHTNCQGCHAHESPDPIPFENTFANKPEYPVYRLDKVKRFIRQLDVPFANLPNRPWAPPHNLVAFASASQSFDDNPAWTEEQRETFRAYQDTGFLAQANWGPDSGQSGMIPFASNVGANRDTMAPTAVLRLFSNRSVLGVLDPDSGIKSVAIQSLPDLVDVKSQFVFDASEDIWVGPAFPQGLKATVIDNHNNTVVRTRTHTTSEPELPEPEPEDCEEQIATLQAEIAALNAANLSAEAKIAELEAVKALARQHGIDLVEETE